MSDTWTALSDDVTLGISDQIRISISFGCAPFSSIQPSEIKDFLLMDKDVTSVLDIQEGFIDSVTSYVSFNCNYIVTVNPANGTKVGDLRGAMYQAINKANDLHTIKASDILVQSIEKKGFSLVPDAPKVTTAISLAAVAIVAIVLLVVFLKLD